MHPSCKNAGRNNDMRMSMCSVYDSTDKRIMHVTRSHNSCALSMLALTHTHTSCMCEKHPPPPHPMTWNLGGKQVQVSVGNAERS
eukprot:9869707-Karenia_brevis.AAC.1